MRCWQCVGCGVSEEVHGEDVQLMRGVLSDIKNGAEFLPLIRDRDNLGPYENI